jgi:type IV secretion system protein VirB4
MRVVYESFGLNDRQISLIAHATPKRDYYYQSPLGQRMFDLGMGPIGLAFAGASRPEDQRAMDALLKQGNGTDFLPAWLHYKGLPWAADLSRQYAVLRGAHP